MRKLFLSFSFLSVHFLNAQSGWVRKTEGYYAKLSAYTAESDRFFDENGVSSINPRIFSQQAVTTYGEYGLNEHFLVIANMPWRKWNSYNVSETAKGIGDPQLELRYGFNQSKTPIAVGIGIEIPLAKQTNLVNFTDGSSTEPANLPTGDGDFNQWLTVAVSQGFGNLPFYATAWGQYHNRTRAKANTAAFKDQMKLGVEIGLRYYTESWLFFKIIGTKPLGNTTNNGNFISADGTQFTQTIVGLQQNIGKGKAITFDYQFYNDWFFQRKNLFSTPLFSLGIAFQR